MLATMLSLLVAFLIFALIAGIVAWLVVFILSSIPGFPVPPRFVWAVYGIVLLIWVLEHLGGVAHAW